MKRKFKNNNQCLHDMLGGDIKVDDRKISPAPRARLKSQMKI